MLYEVSDFAKLIAKQYVVRETRRLEIMSPAFDKLRPEAEKHCKKIQNGLDLFAKYFGALWT